MRLPARNRTPLYASLLCALILVAFVAPRFSALRAEAYSTSARCAIVVDATDGRALYVKNADEKRPIASTTKILTAITVIENTEDLERVVTVPDEAVGVEGSSIYLRKGERMKIVDLLYGLMLRSGNDSAEALAILTSGSVGRFVSLMNKTARRAGAADSHFANPHGLPCEDHYSTARDLALISAYAMRNEEFRTIVSSGSYTFTEEGGTERRTFVNKNKILSMLEGGNGLKTGYTKEAGRCLVASAERDGREIICVVLDCGPMFEECCSMINEAFAAS